MNITALSQDIDAIYEMEEDPYHPQNDQFNKNNEHIKRVIMAHQNGMTPRHVQMIKLSYSGHSNDKVAELTKVTPQTVSRVRNTPEGKRLTHLLKYLASAMDGPSIEHRKAVLNRIMVDNEKTAPKIALAAIAEMNKMGMNEHAIENGESGGATYNVTINQNHFPRTELDG